MKHKGLIAVVVVVAAILYFTGGLNGLFETGTINVKFFDASGNPVGTDNIKSVVTSSSGSVLAQNVANMQFTIKAKNTGELPLVVSLNTLTPSQLDSAFTKIDKTIAPGEETTWTSSLVPTAQFDGTSKTFYVKIRGTYTYGGQTNTIDKEGSVSYSFAIDPVAGLSVTFGSSLGTTDLGVTTNGGTTSTLKTTGTSCTVSSECQSNSCIVGTVTLNSVRYQSQTYYFCCASPSCVSCSEQVDNSNTQECINAGYTNAQRYVSVVVSYITCQSAIKSCV